MSSKRPLVYGSLEKFLINGLLGCKESGSHSSSTLFCDVLTRPILLELGFTSYFRSRLNQRTLTKSQPRLKTIQSLKKFEGVLNNLHSNLFLNLGKSVAADQQSPFLSNPKMISYLIPNKTNWKKTLTNLT